MLVKEVHKEQMLEVQMLEELVLEELVQELVLVMHWWSLLIQVQMLGPSEQV